MYTPLAPGYGTIPGPGGDLLVSPDDARRLGFEPPSFTPPESPVPDGALAMPPPDPMGAAPAIAPSAPVSLAPTPADEPAAPAPVDPYLKAAAPTPAPAASPDAPVPDLSATTYADVLGEQRAAMGAQVKAAATTAELQAQQAEQEAKAIEDRNAAIAAKEDEFKAREADDQKRIADTTALYEAKVKEFADAKVDRNKYKVSPLAAIGVALSGLGSAVKGQGDKNPALDLLMRQIDQYVEDGYRAKAALGQEAGMLKDRLGVLQDTAQNTLASKNLAIAGVTARTAREVEAIAAKMQPGLKRDAVNAFAADVQAKGAQALGDAVQLQHAEDRQKEQLAQAERESRRQAASRAADRAENARQFDLTLAQNIAEKEAAREAAMKTATTAADLAIAERAIPDMFNADGTPYQARTKEEATRIAKSFAATQTLNDRISELIRMKKASGNKAAALKSGEWQKMQANVADIQNSLRTAFEMGTLDKGSLEQMGKLMGGDPMRDGWTEAVLGGLYQDGAEIGLEQLRKNVTDRFNTTANSMRMLGTTYQRWTPPAEPEKAKTDRISTLTKDIEKAQTPDQIRASAEPGSFWSGAGYVAGAIKSGRVDGGGGRAETKWEREALDKAAAVGEGGLNRITKDQRKAIEEMALAAKVDIPADKRIELERLYQAGDPDARKQLEKLALAGRAKQALVGLATGPREDVAAAALETLANLGDEQALASVAEARAGAAKGGKAPVAGARELSAQEAAAAERAAVAATAKAAATQKAIAAGTSPLTLLADRARAGDKAAIAGLEKLSRGGDAADVDLGVIRGNATTKKIAMRELEAILSARGR